MVGGRVNRDGNHGPTPLHLLIEPAVARVIGFAHFHRGKNQHSPLPSVSEQQAERRRQNCICTSTLRFATFHSFNNNSRSPNKQHCAHVVLYPQDKRAHQTRLVPSCHGRPIPITKQPSTIQAIPIISHPTLTDTPVSVVTLLTTSDQQATLATPLISRGITIPLFSRFTSYTQ